MKQNKPLILRVSNQPFPSASPEITHNIQSAVKTKKFIYMDMAAQQRDLRLLSRQSHISDNSNEEAEVIKKNIYVLDIKKLCGPAVHMQKYIRGLRQQKTKRTHAEELKLKTTKFRIRKNQSLRLKTEPSKMIDVEDFLKNRNQMRLRNLTSRKQMSLLNHHKKSSDVCRLQEKLSSTRTRKSVLN